MSFIKEFKKNRKLVVKKITKTVLKKRDKNPVCQPPNSLHITCISIVFSDCVKKKTTQLGGMWYNISNSMNNAYEGLT